MKRVFLVALAVATAAAGAPAAAQETTAPRTGVHWQSAGDSYSSGEGVFGNKGDCAQSDEAYGPAAAQRLAGQGWTFATQTFTACTGHLVEDVFNKRTDSGGKQSLWGWHGKQGGPDRVDVLTFSFGGNDIGFADVLFDCLYLADSWTPWEFVSGATGCDTSEADLKARVNHLLDPVRSCDATRRTGDAFDCDLKLEGRRGSVIDFYYDLVVRHATSRGQLYVVGYPMVFAPTGEWPWWSAAVCSGVKRGDADKLGRVGQHLNTKLRQAVDRANQALDGTRVHYLDRLELFRDGGHELCGTGTDYLNGIAGNRDSGWKVRKDTSFHPNAAGHAAVRDVLVPLVARTLPVDPPRPRPSPTLSARLDPACRTDPTSATLCRFVSAVQSKSTGALSADERRLAASVTDLPGRTWSLLSCEPVGDISALCEIEFDGTPGNSEPAAAGFIVQPVNGEYDVETGAVVLPPGEDYRFEVVEYLGLGVSGTFVP